MPTANELYDEAISLRDAGKKEDAIQKLQEATSLAPDDSTVHGLLAKLHADLGHGDEAIHHAQRVVEIEPEDAFSYTALSVIYQRCGRIPEAEDAKAKAFAKQMGFE